MYFTGWISRQCPKSVFSTRGLSPLWSKSANQWWDNFRLASSHLPFSPKSRPAFASSMASHRLKNSIFMGLNMEKLHTWSSMNICKCFYPDQCLSYWICYPRAWLGILSPVQKGSWDFPASQHNSGWNQIGLCFLAPSRSPRSHSVCLCVRLSVCPAQTCL